MSSTFGERSHGFLNSRSVPHSVEWRRKSAVVPNSSSSQFFTGVTSTATEGPKLLEPSPVTLRNAAAPTSTTACSAFSSTDWASAFPAASRKNTTKTNLAGLNMAQERTPRLSPLLVLPSDQSRVGLQFRQKYLKWNQLRTVQSRENSFSDIPENVAQFFR